MLHAEKAGTSSVLSILVSNSFGVLNKVSTIDRKSTRLNSSHT